MPHIHNQANISLTQADLNIRDKQTVLCCPKKASIYHRYILGFFCILVLSLCDKANAHYPHDNHSFVSLSPNFSTDSTLFIASRQAWSTRSQVPLVSRNSGQSWARNPSGMDNTSMFTSVAVSPRYDIDNTVFMTTQSDGVYRSTDGGNSWEKTNKGLPTHELHFSVAGLSNNNTVVLFVSGVRGGLFRSTDLGTSWQAVLASDTIISALSISPNFATDGLVIVGDPTGTISASIDGGMTWSQYGTIEDAGGITKIAISPNIGTSGAIYIGTSSGLFHRNKANPALKKIDSFATEYVSALTLSPSYATDATLFATTLAQGIFKSTDAGTTWVMHETGHPFSSQSSTHFYDLKLSDNFAIDKTLFLAAFEGLFQSTDGGLNWSELETRPATLITGVGLSPNFQSDGLLAVATYGGGLYVSNDYGDTWSPSNTGLLGTYVYDAAITFDKNADPILFSSYTNNLLISTNNGANWIRKTVGDALPASCVQSSIDISPTFAIDQIALMSCRKEGIVITYDGGDSWQALLTRSELAETSLTAAKLSPNFSIDQTLFAANNRGHILRSQDGGTTWQLITNGLPAPGYWYAGTTIAISPNFANDQGLLIGTPYGLYSSVNGGNKWWPIPDTNSPVFSGVIEHINISPNFKLDHTILTTVRGQGLFRSSNGGETWEQVSQGLINAGYELNNLKFSPTFGLDGTIYGFGHDSLLRSTDRGVTFELANIPFVRHEDSRSQSVHYNGIWSKIKLTGASASTIAATTTAGSSAHLSFWGTGVSWVGYKADNLGVSDIYINDSFVTSIDQYAPTILEHQTLYSISGLPVGTHKIQIIATDRQNPLSSGNAMTIDAFDVLR